MHIDYVVFVLSVTHRALFNNDLSMTTIEKIKAEIMRLHQEAVLAATGKETDWLRSRIGTCVDILSFLDTLEEPVSVPPSSVSVPVQDVSVPPECENLDDELDRFIASGKSVTVDDYGTYKVSYHDFKKVARHFAEWQKAQDDKLVDIIYQQGIEKGKDEMRETLKRKEKK